MDIDNIKYKGGKITFDYAYQEYCTLCNESIWEGNGSYYFNALNLQIHQRDALQFLTQLLSLKIILLDTDMNVVTLIVDFLIKWAQEYVSKQGVTKMEINVTKEGYCPWFELRN